MLMKAAALAAAIPVAGVATVAATGVVVVDVRQADGKHIVVPMPLLPVRMAAALAPAHLRALQIQTPHGSADVKRGLAVAEGVLEALAEAPDAELVRVQDGEEHVSVSKEAGLLHVRVRNPREHVDVNLPLSAAREVLAGVGEGTVDASRVLAALASVPRGDIVTVSNDHEQVRIRMY